MISFRTIPVLLFVLALLLLAAGCESPPDTAALPGTTPSTTATKIPVRHVTTTTPLPTIITGESEPVTEITALPETSAAGTSRQSASYLPEYIRMDAETYNAGDIVQFYLVNRGAGITGCDYARPAFTIYQIFPDGTRRKVSGNIPGISYRAVMTGDPGSATGPLSFNTAGMVPGRYLIRFDCGSNVAREFVIYAKVYVTES